MSRKWRRITDIEMNDRGKGKRNREREGEKENRDTARVRVAGRKDEKGGDWGGGSDWRRR